MASSLLLATAGVAGAFNLPRSVSLPRHHHTPNYPTTVIHHTTKIRRHTSTLLQSASNNNDSQEITPSSSASTSKIDQILSQLTSLFPLFVLGSSITGSIVPSTLNWVNNGNIISAMLAGVMLGTGMTLEKSDFSDILTNEQQRKSIPIGVLCQFILMPLSASIIGRTLLLPYHDPSSMNVHLGKHLFLGLVLVGCSPGGTASNLVSLIAGADVALSVLLTTCSTILASVVTPLLTKFIVGSAIPVSGKALMIATAKVVLLPVAFGVFLNEYFPKLCQQVSRWTPFASVVLVSLICGGVVSNNAAMWTTTGSVATAAVGGGGGGALLSSLPMLILLAVVLTHALGFTAGYLVPKKVFRLPERTARTVSIETGMQNSALAVVLAKSIGADPLSYLPGALSATAHSCLGSMLAAFWRLVDSRKKTDDNE
jgi:BASS family bile acid:Na+ symporter